MISAKQIVHIRVKGVDGWLYGVRNVKFCDWPLYPTRPDSQPEPALSYGDDDGLTYIIPSKAVIGLAVREEPFSEAPSDHMHAARDHIAVADAAIERTKRIMRTAQDEPQTNHDEGCQCADCLKLEVEAKARRLRAGRGLGED